MGSTWTKKSQYLARLEGSKLRYVSRILAVLKAQPWILLLGLDAFNSIFSLPRVGSDMKLDIQLKWREEDKSRPGHVMSGR